ncbi:MAG: hypothetical protein HY000_04360 [Planctomycetes bacterium]|nr:hypothetical protein [Planctomycetota bacterium]
MHQPTRLASGVVFLLCWAIVVGADEKQQSPPGEDAKSKPAPKGEPAPKGNYYRSMPKSLARLIRSDAAARTVTFGWEANNTEHTLALRPGAEIQRFGFWASLDDFQPDDQVYLCVDVDPSDRWLTVHSLLDGVSTQAVFGDQYTVRTWDVAHAQGELVQDGGKKATVSVRIGPALAARKDESMVAAGQKVYWNARYEADKTAVTDVLNAAAFARARREQVQRHFERLAKDGLDGLVNDTDSIDGRLVVTVWRCGTLWARTLQMHDSVQVVKCGDENPAIDAVVFGSRPDYAKAKVRLVVEGKPLMTLRLGDEVRLRMKQPADLDPDLPPDLGRFTGRSDRVSWFLSTVYCTCGMPHDG